MKTIPTQELFPPDEAALIIRLGEQTRPDLVPCANLKLSEILTGYEEQQRIENQKSSVRSFSMRAREAVYGGAFVTAGIYYDSPAGVAIGAAVTIVNEAYLYRANRPARLARARVRRIGEYLSPLAIENSSVTATNLEGETA
ncbi:hypothetical protein BH10PAT3_BH10PAT3_0370 [soil metagenome]